MLRPPILFTPQIVPTPRILPQGSRGFYIRAYRAWLPPHAPDILTVRRQAIDGTRTFTLPDSQPCRLLTFLRFFGSLWCKKIRVLHLILDNGPTHAPKQIKKWMRILDPPFRVKIHWLPIRASRLDQVEIVLSYVQRHSADPEEFRLYSNFSPRKLVERLNTTPEQMERYSPRTLSGSAQGVLFGINAHMANAMTAIAIVCGQDAAHIGNTHLANVTCEATKNGNLYFSAYFSSMFAATVGGGPPSARHVNASKDSGVMETANPNDFEETIAATALAGEISLMTSIVNGTYIYAHETFGKNRPPR